MHDDLLQTDPDPLAPLVAETIRRTHLGEPPPMGEVTANFASDSLIDRLIGHRFWDGLECLSVYQRPTPIQAWDPDRLDWMEDEWERARIDALADGATPTDDEVRRFLQVAFERRDEPGDVWSGVFLYRYAIPAPGGGEQAVVVGFWGLLTPVQAGVEVNPWVQLDPVTDIAAVRAFLEPATCDEFDWAGRLVGMEALEPWLHGRARVAAEEMDAYRRSIGME